MNELNTRVYWIAGTLTAFAGVAIARLLAPALQPAALSKGGIAFGHLMALVGLFVILLGTRKKHRVLMRSHQQSVDRMEAQ